MGPETITKINKKIKQAMKEADLTQTELAKKMNLKQSVISKWVTGTLNPKLSTIQKIAKATGKPLNYFFDNSTNLGNNAIVGNNNSGNNCKGVSELAFQILQKDMELLKKEVELIKLKLELNKKPK